MINSIKRFLKNEEGAETLEYVVIVAIILIVGAGIYNTQFKAVVNAAFTSILSAVGIGIA